MYRFTSTSKPENGKTFLQWEETVNGDGHKTDIEDWKEANEMKIIITKPKNVACGVFLPHKDSSLITLIFTTINVKFSYQVEHVSE